MRRAGLGPRRVRAGPGDQPARGPPGRARTVVPVHRPRPGRGAAHRRRGRRDVPRADRRARHGGRRVRPRRPPVHASADVGGAGPDPAARLASAEIVLEGDLRRRPIPPSGCRLPPVAGWPPGWRRPASRPPTACRCGARPSRRRSTDAPPSGTSPPATTPIAPPSPPQGARTRRPLPRPVVVVQHSGDQRPRAACSSGSPRRGSTRSWWPARTCPSTWPKGGRGRRVGAARRRPSARRRRARPVPAAERALVGEAVTADGARARHLPRRPAARPRGRRRGDGEVRGDRARIVPRRAARRRRDDPLFAGLTGYRRAAHDPEPPRLDHDAAAGRCAPGDVGRRAACRRSASGGRVGGPVPSRGGGRAAGRSGTSPSWPPKGFDRAALLAQATADAPINTEQARALVGAFADVVREACR